MVFSQYMVKMRQKEPMSSQCFFLTQLMIMKEDGNVEEGFMFYDGS